MAYNLHCQHKIKHWQCSALSKDNTNATAYFSQIMFLSSREAVGMQIEF